MEQRPSFLQWQVDHARQHGDSRRSMRITCRAITRSMHNLGQTALAVASTHRTLATQMALYEKAYNP